MLSASKTSPACPPSVALHSKTPETKAPTSSLHTAPVGSSQSPSQEGIRSRCAKLPRAGGAAPALYLER
eukprot:scaffold23776_cov45-Isochrysis_galbana.AAC.1